MTSSQGSEALRRLAEQSRSLLGELDHARPELLSVAELNRTLRQILVNQAALLDTLATGEAAGPRPQIKVLRSKSVELSPLELADLDREHVSEVDEALKGKPSLSNGTAAEAPAGSPQAEAAPVLDAALSTSTNGTSSAPQGAVQAAATESGTTAVHALLAETQSIPMHLCRSFVCDFDNRDADYDKGLEKLNRWISAGSSGTPFQWRGDHAYLNLKGAGAASARTYEEQIMARMGFSRRLGRLEVPGLEGDVVVYERPS